MKPLIKTNLLDQGLLLKFTDTYEQANDLKHGLHLNTAHYYRSLKENGRGDPDELDGDYLMWCATYIECINKTNVGRFDDVSIGNDNISGCWQPYIIFKGDIKNDIITILRGNDIFEPIGKYAAIILNPIDYISKFMHEFLLHTVNLKLDGYFPYGLVPIKAGSVYYGEGDKYSAQLIKKNEKYSNQHEFRIIIDIYKNFEIRDDGRGVNTYKDFGIDLDYNNIIILKGTDMISFNDALIVPIPNQLLINLKIT